MTKLIFIFLISVTLPAALFVGYYETRFWEDDEDRFVFFIKKKPTLQFRFVNIFATESEDRAQLYKVDKKDHQYAIDYCKYHLGIEIEMKTQEEMDTCKRGYYATFKKKPLTYINHESWDVEPE
jgi:hypothetical protein